MNALGVLTIMSLLAPAPGPATPFSIAEDVDEGNATTTASAPTAGASAAAVSETSAISPSIPSTLIRVTEPSADPSEIKSPLTFTASPELGPIHEESDHFGRHVILQRGPSPLAASDHEPEDLDSEVYSPGSLTAMAGASALRSRRPLLSPVRTAGLSAYASTPIKFEGESEHTGDDSHGHDDRVVTALRGHYTVNSDSPYNHQISLIAHHLGHDGGMTSSGTSSTVTGADSGTETDEHPTFASISSLDDHHIYPTIGAIPYESAKPTGVGAGAGGHIESFEIIPKPAHKPKHLHAKKGWSKHWKTALRMLAGLAPLALLLAALPPNVLIVNPTQSTVPQNMRGRTAEIDGLTDEALTDLASCHRVCERVRSALSTLHLGSRESWPGFKELVEAARSPTCAESLCAPDPGTSTTTTTTTTVMTRSATSTPNPTPNPTPADEPENKKQLKSSLTVVKKYGKAMKRRKNPQPV